MALPRIIGLNGVARSGKDTVANILHDLYGYQPVSFSDMLNKALIALDPWVPPESMRASEPWVRYATLIEEFGYEEAKDKFPEVRRLLQHMGTEVGRNLLGANIWVDALFGNLPDGLVAITNVRFPNEFNATMDAGGVVWRVERPGFAAVNGHTSDTALDDYFFDVVISNDGSIRDLASKVLDLLDGPVQRSFQNNIIQTQVV